MLSLAATLLVIAAVSFGWAGRKGRGERAAALLCAVGALVATVRDGGALPGVLVFAVLAMTAASVLVLVTAPRPALVRPLAIGSAFAGALCLLGGLA